MRRRVVVPVVGCVLLLAALAYVRVGWSRMEVACSEGVGVSYSWSWESPGFTCTYDDGSTETSLWF